MAEPGVEQTWGQKFLDPTNLALIAKFGNMMNQAGQDRYLMPNGTMVQPPTVGSALSQFGADFTADYAKKMAADKVLATGAPAPVPVTPAPVSPQPPGVAPLAPAPEPVPNRLSQVPWQTLVSPNGTLTGAINQDPTQPTLNAAPINVVEPSQVQPGAQIMQPPPTVDQTAIVSGLAGKVPDIQDPYAGFRGIDPMVAATMGDAHMKEMATLAGTASTIRAAAEKQNVDKYLAPAAAAKNMADAFATSNPQYVEQQKALGKGVGEVNAWSAQVSATWMEPIANPAIQRAFPRLKTMGQVYQNLGPKASDTIGHILSLQGQYANAAALEKTLYPTLSLAYRDEMGDLRASIDKLENLAVSEVDPSLLTTGQAVQILLKSGAKAFLNKDQAVTLQANRERLATVTNNMNDLTGAMGGILGVNRRDRKTIPSPTSKVETPAAIPAKPATFVATHNIKVGNQVVPMQSVGGNFYYDAAGKSYVINSNKK
jgi:hypothetical protein